MEYRTIRDITDVVIPTIDDYRKFQSHKDQAVDRLRPIFEKDAEPWKIVIDGGTLVPTFRKELGKKRRRYLKKLLYTLDYDWYKSIDFDVE